MTEKNYIKRCSATLIGGKRWFSPEDVEMMLKDYAKTKSISIITEHRDRLGKDLHSDIITDIQNSK